MNITASKWAGALCLTGVFLHMILSAPLLDGLGMRYSGDEGGFYEKIHPGTYFIYLSFAVLLCRQPVHYFAVLYKEQPLLTALLSFYVLLLLYWVLRSGPQGFAFLLDTHISAVLCAIVLYYAPGPYCRIAAGLFLLIALLNSTIGIAETYGKFRIFTFDSSWLFMKEKYFRASALRGHPLDNSAFTAIAIFIAAALCYPLILKGLLITVYFISLVAFGGRAGLIFALCGISLLSVLGLIHIYRSERSIASLCVMLLGMLMFPAILLAFACATIHSPLGERILSHMNWDESAHSRELAFAAFHYVSPGEILTGISAFRIQEIVAHINAFAPMADIENPWVLMALYCGLILFPLWLGGTAAFWLKLTRHKPLALQLAVVAYILIASTSNSFGRKDSNYLIMVSMVICVGNILQQRLLLPQEPACS